MSTGRPEATAARLRLTFPNVTQIGLNLEASCECAVNLASLVQLLRILVAAKIRITSYEVYLIQLPTSRRTRNQQVSSLATDLRGAGVLVSRPPVARSTKEFPCDGFKVPACLHMTAPVPVSEAISDSIWQIVW